MWSSVTERMVYSLDELSMLERSPLLYHTMAGVGLESTGHFRVAESPKSTAMCSALAVNCGPSGTKKKM